MTEDQLETFAKDAVKYANDPSTDRPFLACKFLEAMLRGNATITSLGANAAVKRAFEMADEFIKQLKEKL